MELDEKQIEVKGRQFREKIIPALYEACIENNDLRLFIAAGWVEVPSIIELIEAQIQKCIERRRIKDMNGEQLYLVDKAVRSVSMNMNIDNAENKGRSLKRAYANSLRAARFVNIIEKKTANYHKSHIGKAQTRSAIAENASRHNLNKK